LHVVFRAINRMERSLRELIAARPTEEFRGIYLEGGLQPTRKNVLVPGSLGVYTGGSNYNPAQVLRDASVASATAKIDKALDGIANRTHAELTIDDIKSLLEMTRPDEAESEHVWDPIAIAESISQYAKLRGQSKGYVYVDRDRDLQGRRRETAGVLTGGEVRTVPDTHLTLFMLRTKAHGKEQAAWWPQIRFPTGRYAFAFAI
jgi:hypothetical protein